MGRAAGERVRVDLDLDLPLRAGERARNRRCARCRSADRGKQRRDTMLEGVEREDGDVRGRLGRSRAGERVQRLEEDVGSGDDGNAGDGKTKWLRALSR